MSKIHNKKVKLKNENYKKKAHRVFKMYKATGKFPPDVSTLEAYDMLSSRYDFISKEVDKKEIKKLIHICNKMKQHKVIILLGDFWLESLYFGLNSFKHDEHKKIKIIGIDTTIRSVRETIGTSYKVKNISNEYIIYIIDNIDRKNFNKDDLDFIVKMNEELQPYDKSIVCCAQDATKLSYKLSKITKIRFGIQSKTNSQLTNYLSILFSEKNRLEAYEKLKGKLSINKYVLDLIAHNLCLLYKSSYHLEWNTESMLIANKNLYKLSNDAMLRYLVFAVKPIKASKCKIRYPKKTPNVKVSVTKKDVTLTDVIGKNSKKSDKTKLSNYFQPKKLKKGVSNY